MPSWKTWPTTTRRSSRRTQLLKEQLAAHEDRQRGVIERERSLQDTLVTTQRLVEEMKMAAKREADLIVREAELRGDKAVEAARSEEAKLRVEIQALRRLRRQSAEEVALHARALPAAAPRRGRGRSGRAVLTNAR